MPQEPLTIVRKLPEEPELTITKAPQPDSWFDTAVKLLNTIPGVPHPEDLKKLTQALPAIGGAAGGFLGAAGGAGIASVPGAVAGATLGGAAGEGLRQSINRISGDTLSGTESAKRIGMQGAIQGGSELVGGAVVAPLMRHAGGVLMQSAVKPGVKTTAKAIAKGVSKSELPVVRTLLKDGVSVTPGGINKLDELLTSTNAQIRDIIKNLPGDIDPSKAAGRADDVIARVSKQVDPESDIAAAQGVKDRFLSRNKQPLKPVEAQDLKTGTYAAIKSKSYGEMKSPEIEANKAIARGLKEEIETAVKKTGAGLRGQVGLSGGVDIAKLNAKEGTLIDAKEAIAKRLAQAGNRDPVSLAWLANNPAAGLAMVIERSPAVKSMLARAAYGPASTVARVPENVLRLMVTALAQSTDTQEAP